MPKKSEIEKQIADLQSQLDSADTDDEVWVKDASGHEVKVSGKRATSILSRFADLWADESGDGDGDGDGDDDGVKDDKKPAGKSAGGYFGRAK